MSILPLEIELDALLPMCKEYVWVDVRRQDEYDKAHIPDVVLAPLGEAFLSFLENEMDPTKKYVFICARGGRSLQAAQLARELKECQGQSLRGGMHLWLSRSDLPVVKS